jgi:HPt (histidine-containing phosphotransfer) domain-containing protein
VTLLAMRELMVNHSLPPAPIIPFLTPFISHYSTKLKRFAPNWPGSKNRARVLFKAWFMDDLLREFLTETNASLDTVDNQLVRFEQDPNNAKILDNIFRLVHTIKGTCGFLGLPRLEALAHAAETLMGKFRDGMPVVANTSRIGRSLRSAS